MTPASQRDPANGYEAASAEFIAARNASTIGVAEVREWAKTLPSGANALDLGCGHGVPIAQALVGAGLSLYGIDASPSMIAAFRRRFPEVPAQCSAAEDSDFFGRKFEGVVAWGLMFLLEPKAQVWVIQKVAAALRPGGQFLFTSPQQVCEWTDNTTGRISVSLGRDGYQGAFRTAGLSLECETDDQEANHYYFVRKPDRPRQAV